MSGRLNLHSRRIENSSPPPEEKNESPPHPNNQSRLAMCPFSENKSRLGSGVTTPSMPTLGSSQHGGVPPPPRRAAHPTRMGQAPIQHRLDGCRVGPPVWLPYEVERPNCKVNFHCRQLLHCELMSSMNLLWQAAFSSVCKDYWVLLHFTLSWGQELVAGHDSVSNVTCWQWKWKLLTYYATSQNTQKFSSPPPTL